VPVQQRRYPHRAALRGAFDDRGTLVACIRKLRDALRRKAVESDDVIKIGRTHLADATPMCLGQEFGGYARQIELSMGRIETAARDMQELPLGGTAIGTGINAHPEFAARSDCKDRATVGPAVSRGRESLGGPRSAGCRRARQRQSEIARRRPNQDRQ
jgi:fumarate hydratase class II